MSIRTALKTCLLAAGIALLILPSTAVHAQAVTQNQTVRGPDGWPIHFTYYPALETVENVRRDTATAGVLILLHGKGGSRLFWDKTSAPPMLPPFAEMLQSKGFAVLAVDLRKHGDSAREGDETVTTNDYELMVGDLVALKQFIFNEHQAKRLNMRKLGIVAMDDHVPIAAAYAEYDWKLAPYDDHPLLANCTPRGQDVQALVMISPASNAGRIQATRSLRFLAAPEFGIAFQVVVGTKDRDARKAKTIYNIVKRGDDPKTELVESVTNERSARLFGNPRIAVEGPILRFLIRNVADRDIEWRDRRSRTERGE